MVHFSQCSTNVNKWNLIVNVNVEKNIKIVFSSFPSMFAVKDLLANQSHAAQYRDEKT